VTGGAFGSMIAQLFRLTAAERKTLLVAGAAAGMSATFAAPVAAALLAVELLLFEWKPRSLVPVALASVTASLVRRHLLGVGPLFPVPAHATLAHPSAIAACVLCGILAGALSALLTLSVYAFEDLFQKLPIHWMWWPAIGGLVIGIGGLIEPRALGVGYDVIEALLRGELVGTALVVLVAVKWTIWSAALGSGTSGGVLAPLLIMGAALGGIEARFFPSQGTGYWALISMGAILGGTMRSPFTAVIFALELTHDVNVLVPLFLAVTCAHAFTVLALKRSILTEKVSRRGFHLSREYATDPLEILFTREVMSTDVAAIPASLTRHDISDAINGAQRVQQLFVVVDEAGELLGIVTRWMIDQWCTGSDDGATVASIVQEPVIAHGDEPLRVVVHRMATTNRAELPVVARDDRRKLIGTITLRDMLKARVRHLEEEERRERVLPLSLIVPPFLRLRAAPRRPAPATPDAIKR
jgi:CIC family chloride channel protein